VAITVAEALKIGGLRRGQLVAGARNAGNVIQHIDTMEVPDIRPWLRKNELLVTTAYAIRDDIPALTRLIEALADVKAAGLVIKPARFIGELPEAVVKTAEELGVPLVEIPADVPFIEITHPLMKAILSRQARYLEYSETVHRELLRVELEGQGYGSIAATLSSLLDAGIVVYDTDFNVMASVGEPELIPTTEQRLYLSKLNGQGRTRIGDSSWEYCCQPVRVKRKVLGYIAVSERNKQLNDMELTALEHACTAVALEITKQQAVSEASKRLEMDLFDDLLDGSVKMEEVAEGRARALGWPVGRPFYVIVARVDDFEKKTARIEGEHLTQSVKHRIARAAGKAVASQLGSGQEHASAVFMRGDSLVCLVPASEELVRQRACIVQAVQRAVAALDARLSLSTGISSVRTQLTQVPTAYKEARNAASIARSLYGGGGVVHIEDVALYALLLDSVERPLLDGFCKRILGPLFEDREGAAMPLIETLEALTSCNGSRVEAARKLFIHRNTLAYRIKKAEELLGKDLADPEYLLALSVALKLRRILASR
jgi:purine catabolism regulator